MAIDILERELKPVPEGERLHIKAPTHGTGCWSVRIRSRPLKTYHEHVDAMLAYTVVWGMQHWALEVATAFFCKGIHRSARSPTYTD